MALQREFKTQGDYLFKNRSYLPILFLLVGLAVLLYGEDTEPVQIEEIHIDLYKFVCLTISLLGLLIRIFTVAHTPKNTSGRNTMEGQLADELNTTGMYSLVRHPLYLGNFFMWLSVGMLTENFWFTIAFVLLYWLYYERIMYVEENFLIDKFGDRYLVWARHTPAFVPSFKNYVNPKYSFCILKVLKKEKNGLAAIFLIFWLFDWAGSQFETRTLHIYFDFWFYAAITSTTIYLILKVMKKKNMLTETNT
ncbi:MAG: lipid A phosphate methyltransferase [Cytophagaceae bacterium]|nr:lipid A phosphate methyltransferase [Cytophagaceae bacterium]|tara:strand:+ start:208 stop:960 length:753 start_codon:yes stop_codon:yes gene_type:complete